ncbi:kinase-like protein, partial [Obba rivulosa]
LDTIDTSDHLRRKSFDLLRRICGQNHIIPKSFTLPPNAVRLISERPEASGGFADIWRGIYSGRTVAFKVFRVYKLEEITGSQADLKEAVVWRRLQHPNITPLYGIDEATFPSQLALVSDWMPHGTVASFLNQNTEANRLRLALDIAQGLQYLHEMNVVHGDMKSANVLVNERRAACISDFGLAAMSYSSKLVTVSVQAGSVRWMSPELLDPEEHGLERAELSPSSDVFALGMVLWEASPCLFTGRIPYYKVQKDAQVMTNILRNIRPRRPVQATPLGLSDDVWSLVEACWLVERRSRPSTAAVVGRLQDALAQHERAGANVAPQVWPLDVD